ncbi:MAG: 1-deoxy-D-xylulose-5-phosphate reductoisomerase [Planctomycetales bacterium]|nr:1-deoxy-D-xylulose-5-phosphate reductoisomerase [Planctomycetales bacterium]
MSNRPKNVVILGSTGSIGQSTLDVIRGTDSLFAYALTAHSRLAEAALQCQEFSPHWFVGTCEEAFSARESLPFPSETEVLIGSQNVRQVVQDDAVDIVVSAIVGAAGLYGTIAALEAGKQVALANKESLVMAGHLVMRLVNEKGGTILPVDSEHSAIFQAKLAGKEKEIKKIWLTASGGPFLRRTREHMASVTVAEALAHPTWEMGRKISIDSATMMNKALEIIEAKWLFGLQADQIGVVVHPQSIVHSLVEFVDGSVIAQLSPPDMRLPIQFALNYPDRKTAVAETFDWQQAMHLDFEPPDLDRFPALGLGFEVAKVGGSSGAVLNAANEVAVSAFLDEAMSFADIVPACRSVLEQHNFETDPTLEQLIELDRWARQEVLRWTR